ncbi:exodeoxyribonuclease I [Rehaibacterium terrae]|jgi:exodeoxyribonuclease-1|uniref:Exodeoxyribonuclease I n=1 Tax=Rehaibacterium terrae TaxID=1341696 RepID=A0A7W7Y199_9GAMM|nr:exodeoxyribonuclease I [Rehaibacterium terrae]MBB5016252.1 exodeoxyribonuclease-1 [Rehaibacterium terrae]
MGSFYWYDLETFGRSPRQSRIAQFAGLRTDENLDPVGEPLVLFCRPADDLLPSPGATLVTGITPQQALREGLREAEFVARLHDELVQPGTCAVGYNSLRFDDEFIRHALYRNFFDPYEREWRNGNSRWDLLDLMRLAFALRPDGMEWPRREDGAPSFKLEHLTAANGIAHGQAHDALSDVQALVGLARKLRAAQPRLWDYYLGLRDKRRAAALVDAVGQIPFLHISGKYPATRGCAALVVPVAPHPSIPHRVIVFDLDSEPDALIDLSAEDIADRLYTPTADLPEGESRIPLKEIHLNRSPAIVPLEYLRDADFARLGIDREACLARAELIRRADGLAEKVRRVYARPPREAANDVDAALYDGFPDDGDRRLFVKVRTTPPEALGQVPFPFVDPRYTELLFRYRARNWPDTLTPDERARWDEYRRRRLSTDLGLSEHTFDSYFAEIAELRAASPDDGRVQTLMDALQSWGLDLQRSL